MAELRDIDLLYGHPGAPTYQTDAQVWHFTRQPGISRQIKLLESPLAIFPACKINGLNVGNATSRLHGRSDLLKHRPELAPAAFLLPNWDIDADGAEGLLLGNAQTSEAIDAVTSIHEPQNSDLFALGRMNFDKKFDSPSSHPELLATAAGACGEILRLSLLNEEQIHWEDIHGPRLLTKTAVGAAEGFWMGHPSPIRQIIFTEAPEEGEIWLAVRQDVTLTILKPTLRKRPVYQAKSEFTGLRPSIVDANPVYRLNIDEDGNVGKAAFSDVAFNPWNHLQVATINQEGYWSIWIPEVASRAALRNTLRHHAGGALYDDFEERGGKAVNIQDRWARIIWAGDSCTILVAGRRTLQMFDLSTQPQRLEVPDLGLVNSEDWILDIKRSSVDKSHVFILTSSRLIWLQVLAPPGDRTETPVLRATLLVSWIHFRDPDDMTLCMSLVEDIRQDEDTVEASTFTVALYSRGNALSTVFAFQYDNDTSYACSKSDPYLLPCCRDNETTQEGLGTHFEPRRQHASLSSLQLRPLRTQKSLSVKAHLNVDYGEVKFYKCYRLGLDLSLSEQLCIEWPQDRSVAPIFLENLVRLRSQNETSEPLDEFIVPDGPLGDEVGENSDAQDTWLSPLSSTSHTRRKNPAQIDMSWLFNEVIESRSLGRNDEDESVTNDHAEFQSLERFLDNLGNLVDWKIKETDSGIDLLHEIKEHDTIAMDIDLGAAALRKSVQDFNFTTSLDDNDADLDKQEGAVAISSLPPAVSRLIGLGEGVELDQIYESLIATYLKPLSRKIPSRLRVATERQLRFAATNICLAAHSIRRYPTEKNGESAEQVDMQSSNRQSPFPVRQGSSTAHSQPQRPRRGSSPFSESLANDVKPEIPSSPVSLNSSRKNSASQQFSRKIPLSSSYLTPSDTYSSQDSLAETLDSSTQELVEEDAPIQRLRLLASLNSQPALPPNLSNVLSHWTEGADPAGYDWTATQQRIQAAATASEKEEAGEERGQKKRKKNKAREKGEERYSQPPSSFLPSQIMQSQTQTQTLMTPSSTQPQQDSFSSPQRGLPIRLPSPFSPTNTASQSQGTSLPLRSSQAKEKGKDKGDKKRIRGF